MIKNTLNYKGSCSQLLLWPSIMFVIATVALIIVVFSITTENFWGTLNWPLSSSADGGEFSEYCERNRMLEFIRQPSNSWSNISYMLLGFVCISFGIHDWRNVNKNDGVFIVRYPVFSILYGLSLTYLCFGSFLFHASLTKFTQQLDMSGVYAVVLIPIVLNFIRIASRHITSTKWIPLVGVASILTLDTLFYIYKWSISAKTVLPLLILLIIATTISYHALSKTNYSKTIGLLAIVSMVIAFGLWTLDRNYKDIMCDPNSIVQGHALWHILTGISTFCVYLLFRSEKPRLTRINNVE